MWKQDNTENRHVLEYIKKLRHENNGDITDKHIEMRSVNEILETQKSCNPGDMAVEIFDLSYKIRNEIPLTKRRTRIKRSIF